MELWEKLGIIILAIVFLVIGIITMAKTLFNPFDNKGKSKYVLEYKATDKKFNELLKALGIDLNKGLTTEKLAEVLYLLTEKLEMCYDTSQLDSNKFYGYFTIENNYLIIHLYEPLKLLLGNLEEKIISIPIISKEPIIPTIEYKNYIIVLLNINDWEKVSYVPSPITCFINKNILAITKNKEVVFGEKEIKKDIFNFFSNLKLKTLSAISNSEKEVIFVKGSCMNSSHNFSYNSNYNVYNVISCHSPKLINKESLKIICNYLYLKYQYLKQIINDKKDILTFKEYLKKILNLKEGKNLEELVNLICGQLNEIQLDIDSKKETILRKFQNTDFINYDINTKKIVFYLPSKKENIFKNIFLDNVFIYKIKEDSSNNEKFIEIEEKNINSLCDANLKQAKNEAKINLFSSKDVHILTITENINTKNFKFSKLLIQNYGFLINKKGFLFIKEYNKIITPFGEEELKNFEDLKIKTILKNKEYKLNKLKDGKYCVTKIEKDKEGKITINLKEGLC